MAARPLITSFGSTFGEFGGTNINNYVVSSDIQTDNLNENFITDVVEFSDFEKSIHDFVLMRLGHPMVRVELYPNQIKTAIDEAISTFHYHSPVWTRQYAVFQASAGINVYELPKFIMQNLEYVVYKKTLLSIQAQAGTLEFDFFIRYFQDSHLFTDFSIGEFFLLQQNLEMIRKILSQEGSWDIINGKYIQVSPTPVITPQNVILEYRALDSATILPQYRNWMQRFALAICKDILGEIRGKHASLPGPQGGTILNGPALKAEAKVEREQLMEELVLEIEEPPTFTTF